MKEFKGTKTKWETSLIWEDKSEHLAVLKDCIGVKSERRAVAICGKIDNEEAKANAQLISAAPELLKLCQELYNGDYGLSGAIARDLNDVINKALGL